ncbi:MAG TPA: BamA/TamA family outer membrane protein [Gemmatimonadaceae bacterium]
MRKILDRCLILAVLCVPDATHAQAADRALPTGWEWFGLPALNYNTDEGFGYGVLAELYNYGSGLAPYKYTIQPTIFLTTKGRRDVVLLFDAPHVLPNGWRFAITAAREQQLANPYYGIGNSTVYDSTLERAPNPYYYRFEKVQVRLVADVQHSIGASPARMLFGAGIADVRTDATPFDSGTTLLATQLGGAAAPKGRVGFVRAGVVWDTRDREIGPSSGTWADFLVQRADGAFGATNSFTRVTATVRHYVPVRSNLILAVRVLAQQATGDVPLYELTNLQSSYKSQDGLGGEKSLRGIAKNRFAGKGVVLENTELRWRFKQFSLYGKTVSLIASGFLDAGRVWAEAIKAGEIVKDLHAGYGGGLRIGLGPSFVIATDLGLSSASTQLYVGVGYLF